VEKLTSVRSVAARPGRKTPGLAAWLRTIHWVRVGALLYCLAFWCALGAGCAMLAR